MGTRPFQGAMPRLHPSVFIADGARVIGNVEIGEESSVWYNTVLRGDVNTITIGARTNIQDLSVIHVEKGTHPTRVGNDVTVGHHVVIHGCTIGNRVLVGIGAIVLNGVVIEDDAFIAAGTLLIPGTVVPSGSMVMGSPGKVRRPLTEAERAGLLTSAAGYVLNAKLHRGG
ncbi:MAG TPA: gamma carbonic anhydrase family protein [Myxococcaceae bacterium]|nr:gamma carbonic anhydrase family protein [Myxococcaceae bacterium]